MTLAAERELQHLGETTACADHDFANADWRDNLKQFWSEMKVREQENIRRLKELLAEEVRNGCF